MTDYNPLHSPDCPACGKPMTRVEWCSTEGLNVLSVRLVWACDGAEGTNECAMAEVPYEGTAWYGDEPASAVEARKLVTAAREAFDKVRAELGINID